MEVDPDLSFYPGPVALWLIRLAGGVVAGLVILKGIIK